MKTIRNWGGGGGVLGLGVAKKVNELMNERTTDVPSYNTY